MHLHVNAIASLRRPDRANGDDVIVAMIVWSAGAGFEPVAELGGMGSLFICVVSRLVIPGLIGHEPIGPGRFLYKCDTAASEALYIARGWDLEESPLALKSAQG